MNRSTVVLASCAVALALIVGWQLMSGRPSSQASSGSVYVPTVASQPPSSSVSTPADDGDGGHGPVESLPATEDTEVVKVAGEFMRLYVKASTSKDGPWQVSMNGLVDEEMKELLATIDPARVTVRSISGAVHLVEADDMSATVEVGTDKGVYTLYLYRAGVVGNTSPLVYSFATPGD